MSAAAVRLYNTLSGQVEEFRPLKAGEVGMYTCGPTVHNFSHIGNFRTFLFEDLLRRVLQQAGYRVTQVMNITDVEDRIIKKAAEAGVSIDEFTAPYITAFMEDLKTLHIQSAERYPRATQHIAEMVALVERLRDRGHAYQADGSWYFRIVSFPPYGRLSHLEARELKVGARVDVDEYGKDDPRDFALWKAPKPGEHFWETAIGPGRPGWHLECSAMSMKYLGESFDLHAGGVDLIFPHHEDEIAQSEATTGKPFVRVWMHPEHLQDAVGEKMSKRLGNFTTLRDLLAEGFDPRVIRYALLTGAHWRSKLAFSMDLLRQSESALKRLDDFAVRLQAAPETAQPPREVRHAWDTALFDDLNLPVAVARLFEWVREVNTRLDSAEVNPAERASAMAMLRHADRILDAIRFPEGSADGEVERLIAEREVARTRKDWARADAIRRQLLEMGIQLEDTRDGTIWKRSS